MCILFQIHPFLNELKLTLLFEVNGKITLL